MASLETSTAPGSWSLAVSDQGKQDTAAPAPSISSTHLSDPDENQVEEPARLQVKEIKELDKGKDRAKKTKKKKKHGVMSLPAEIRETYAFQSPSRSRLLT